MAYAIEYDHDHVAEARAGLAEALGGPIWEHDPDAGAARYIPPPTIGATPPVIVKPWIEASDAKTVTVAVTPSSPW